MSLPVISSSCNFIQQYRQDSEVKHILKELPELDWSQVTIQKVSISYSRQQIIMIVNSAIFLKMKVFSGSSDVSEAYHNVRSFRLYEQLPLHSFIVPCCAQFRSLDKIKGRIQPHPLLDLGEIKKLGDRRDLAIALTSFFLGHDDFSLCHFSAVKYVPSQDLLDYTNKRIRSKRGYSLIEIKFILALLSSAVLHLHNNNIAHRDIKMENILVDSTGYVMLSDFEYCEKADEPSHRACGTMTYVSPELFKMSEEPIEANRIPIDGKGCDMWALAIVVYCVASQGHFPFLPKKDENYLSNLKKMLFEEGPSYEHRGFYQYPVMKSLLEKMFVVDPSQRLKINDLFQLPPLNDISIQTWNNLRSRLIASPLMREDGLETSHS